MKLWKEWVNYRKLKNYNLKNQRSEPDIIIEARNKVIYNYFI